jgi:formylglycine-generating enzyme required for sulfatase activity
MSRRATVNKEFRIFISSTSRDLREHREAIQKLLKSYCLDVIVQTDYMGGWESTFGEIDGKIARADLVLCLIGAAYGEPLPQEQPAGIPASYSWTQYEYWKSGQEKKRRLICFHKPQSSASPIVQQEDVAQLQAGFIANVVQDQRQGNGLDTFWHEFDSVERIVQSIQGYLENGQDALITEFRERRWELARQAFRKNSVQQWHLAYPDVYNGNSDWQPTSPKAPFIDNQNLELLDKKQNEIYLPDLSPAAFVVGRDTEAEAKADTGIWSKTTLSEITEALLIPKGNAGSDQRIFIVSGGGVGKTESLKRLTCLLNEAGLSPYDTLPVLAFNFPATQLPENSEEVLGFLVENMQNSFAFPKNAGLQEIERFLMRERKLGRVVLLIDGLDHVQSDKSLSKFLIEIQSDTLSSWNACPIVLSGRPYVIQSHFSDLNADWQQRLLASRWRFSRPCEFTTEQQKVYLGGDSQGRFRYDNIPREAQSILSVPRVLRYVRNLEEKQLRGIKTSADVYCRAMDNLVSLTMQESHTAIQIHPDEQAKAPPPGNDPNAVQVEYVKTMLAAAAFVMTNDFGPQAKPNFNRAKVTDAFQHEIYRRLQKCGSLGYKDIRELKFQKDFSTGLGAFNSVVSNGIIETSQGEHRNVDNTLQDLIWDNKSVQCFFTAYWLSKFGLNAGCGDSETFCSWMIWYHESEIDDYYELNQFLAEMPDSHRDAVNWLASVEGWFRPPTPDEIGTHLRSSEMMYRSWPTLIQLAMYPADNWWNVPYEKLYQSRMQIAALTRKSKERINAATENARSVLSVFRGELQGILQGEQGTVRQQIACDFIQDDHWKAVPAASDGFQMGYPDDRQGFPKKSRAYWRDQLRRVIDGVAPLAVSKECNDPAWFSGAQGVRALKEDVEWLRSVFAKLAAQRNTSELETARERAMQEIADNWRRKDETPAESSQKIAEFEMQRYATLNDWFWLFAAGHQQSVRDFLNENVGIQQAKTGDSAMERGLNPEHGDHPVIYVSWFDCWAFCQWAHWTVTDPNDPTEPVQFRCRLPHEPEWEFAARCDANGPIPFEQRYWWGDAFYENDDSPEIEPKSNELAHAVGPPGQTRAANKSVPNGFGFHDILGNVWEWAANVYSGKVENGKKVWFYSRHLPLDIDQLKVNSQRSMRGGLWYFLDVLTRCSSRFRCDSDERDYKMGFRVIRERIDDK